MLLGYYAGFLTKQRHLVKDKSHVIVSSCVSLLLGLAISGCVDQPGELQTKQRLFLGPTFITNDPDLPEAKAVLVNADGTIAQVFATQPGELPNVEIVRLSGELAVPGGA